MKALLLTAMCALLMLQSFAQSYPVGRQTVTITDPQRNNRAISTELYYPAVSNGNNTPIATGSESFPVVVFGHGFLIPTGAYKWLGDSLAKNGFIVAMPNTEGSFLPSHGNFGADLSFVGTAIVQWNNDAASPFFQRVLNKVAVGGHSMGGGASFLAAGSGNTSINALFNFAAAETNPSATNAALSVNVPSLIFSGSRDCIVPPATQLAMYNNISPANCKAYVNITDGLHCHFSDNNFVCATGQVLTGCNASPLSASQLYAKTTTLLIPFLNFHLKNICLQGELFQLNFNTITGVTKQIQCLPFPSCGVVPVNLLFFNGQHVDKRNKLKWKSEQEINFKEYALERSADGRTFSKIKTIEANAGSSINVYEAIDELPYSGNNFYRLKMIDIDYSFSYSEVINVRTPVKDVVITAVFPNPVKDLFKLEIQSNDNIPLHCTIWDVAGRCVLSKNLNTSTGLSTNEISLMKQAPGVYWLKVTTSNGTSIGKYKLIKQ